MTEEELKKTWCPHVRLVVVNLDGSEGTKGSFNRMAVRGTSDFRTPDASLCIGSACSQFRSRQDGVMAGQPIQRALADRRRLSGDVRL